MDWQLSRRQAQQTGQHRYSTVLLQHSYRIGIATTLLQRSRLKRGNTTVKSYCNDQGFEVVKVQVGAVFFHQTKNAMKVLVLFSAADTSAEGGLLSGNVYVPISVKHCPEAFLHPVGPGAIQKATQDQSNRQSRL
eukprot:785490-Pelagomonas_calceolata.AAC.1